MANETDFRICLLRKKRAKKNNVTLQSMCHKEVFRMCCKIAQNGNTEYIKQWRNSLNELPHCLLNDLMSDYR